MRCKAGKLIAIHKSRSIVIRVMVAGQIGRVADLHGFAKGTGHGCHVCIRQPKMAAQGPRQVPVYPKYTHGLFINIRFQRSKPMNTQLLSEAKKLTLDERIELVEAIWDSLVPEAQNKPLPESHRHLLDERFAQFTANPSAGSPWEEVQARLEALD